MGAFNPSTPAVEGSEFQPTSHRRITLNSPRRGIAMRVRPGSLTIDRLHPLLRAVEGNPGIALEVLTSLTPTIQTSTFLPGTDTGATVTGWQDQGGSTVNFGDVDQEFWDGTNYARNTAALSATGALDLLFRGDNAGALGADRVLSVRVGAVLRLTGAAGNAREVDVAARLVLNGAAYPAAARRQSQRSTFDQRPFLGSWPLNPETGIPWVAADFDDIIDASDADRFGIRVRGKLAAQGFRVGGLFLSVDHCTENRIGHHYSGGAPRRGWVEHVLAGTAAASADTFYWLHLYALNGSTEDYLVTSMVHDPVMVIDHNPAGAGDPRMVVRTTLSGPGGVAVETVDRPGRMMPILFESSGSIQPQSQPYSDLDNVVLSRATVDAHVGQQITTPDPTSTFAGVMLAAGWQDARRRPNRPLIVEVRTGSGAATGGGTLVATATLRPEDSGPAVAQHLVPFTAPFTAAAGVKHHVLISSRATAGRGWNMLKADSRSDLVTAGGGTTVNEVQGATQGGQTDSFTEDGTEADRWDLLVALFSPHDGPTGLTATPFAGIGRERPSGVLLTWTRTLLGGHFGAYRVYRRPHRAQAQPWHLIAENAPRSSQTPAVYEETHPAFLDIMAGTAAAPWCEPGPGDHGWDYAVTVTHATTGIESDPADATITNVVIPAAETMWLASNQAPWLVAPVDAASRFEADVEDRTAVHEVAGRDGAVTRTRAEDPVRSWRLRWQEPGFVARSVLRSHEAIARSGRRVAMLTTRGDRAVGVITHPVDSHNPEPLFEIEARLVETAGEPVAEYNLPAGALLDGIDDHLSIDDHPDLDPGTGEFTVIVAARIPATPDKAVAAKAAVPSTLPLDARIWLSAGEVDPDTWAPGDPWPNRGTLGAAGDAVTAANTPPESSPINPTLIPDGQPRGAGFQVGAGSSGGSDFGFQIPHHASLDIPTATGGVTYTVDFTPLDHTDPTYKILQKYPAVDLPTSQEGWILEHVDDTGGGPGSGGLLTAAHDGTTFYGVTEHPNIEGRQRVTARWDRDTGVLSFWRQGIELGTFDISGMGDTSTAAPIRLGQDVVYHNVLVHDRALDDDEIEELHNALAPDGTGWMIGTDGAGSLLWGVTGTSRVFAQVTSTSQDWFSAGVVVVGADSDGSTLRLFRNGVVDKIGTGLPHGVVANPLPVLVGAIVESGGVAHHIALDHQAIAYYPRRLTAAEHAAAAHWLLGHHGGRMPAGAVMFHDLRDDRSWDASGTTVHDLTGRDHTAELAGSPIIHGRPWPLDELDD